MLGQVQPQQLLLPAQPLSRWSLGHVRQLLVHRDGLGRAEDPKLRAVPFGLQLAAERHGSVERVQQLVGMTQLAQRADPDERLEHPLVREPEVDPRAEIRQRLERAARFARGDDRLDRALPDILDRDQPEADGLALDRELDAGAEDVGRSDLDAHPPALGDGGGHLLGVVAEGCQHGGHVFDREVRLQVCGLVGDQPVAGRVCLVEAVALERLEGLEHGIDDLRLDATLGRLGDELLALRPEDGRLLLADRKPQSVGLRSCEAAQGDRGGHDVLLVDEDPVGLLQVGLEQRVQVGHRLLAVLAPNVGGNVVHRPGSVQGDQGGEVVYGRGAEVADVAAHARRLELEDAGRLAGGEELECLGVVERDAIEIDLDAALLPDEVDGVTQDRQVREAEEVELQESERLDPVHLVLAHQRV